MPEPKVVRSTTDAWGDSILPMDPRRLLGVLRRRAWIILAVGAAGAAIAGALGIRAGRSYRATAVIRVRDARQAVTGGLVAAPDVRIGPLVDPMLSLIEVLGSRGVAGTVVDSIPILRLRAEGLRLTELRDVAVTDTGRPDTVRMLVQASGVRLATAPDSLIPWGHPVVTPGLRLTIPRNPGTAQALVSVGPREAAIDGLLQSVKVEALPNTDIIDVRYSAPDSALARAVTNRLVLVLRAIDAEMGQAVSRARTDFLKAQLTQTEADLARSRKALADFRARQRAFSTRERFSAQEAGVSAVSSRRAQLDAQRRLYRALLARLSEPAGAGGSGIHALLSSPGLSDNPVIRQTADQLARYESQRDSLTAGRFSAAQSNPDVQRLDALIGTSRQRLADAVNSIASVLDAQISSLDASRSREVSSFRELSSSEEQEAGLAEDLEAVRKLADELRAEFQRAELAEAVNLGQVEVIDLAGPAREVGLSARTKTVLGLLLGLAIGMLTALIVEYLQPAIRRQEDLAATLGAASPAVIPRSMLPPARRGSNGRSALVATADPNSGGAEAYRSLRTALLFSPTAAGLRTLLVTSAVPGEGKTTVAANLAAVFAQQGIRVLLIDGDLRRARLHGVFHVQRTPGLTTLVEGAALPEQAVHSTDVPNLFFLASGAAPPNPTEVIGSKAMAVTLKFLSGQYDLVVVDSPPLLSAADASILATLVDGAVMVVRAGKLHEDVVRMAQQQVENVGGRVVAAVLNDPDAEVKRYGGDYYFTGYPAERSGKS
jgi:capsular exopolysaccharide synthesis family protein